jgi:nicotinate-nucleotide--dimethylbenzimidazole phosphoribosyltransferase
MSSRSLSLSGTTRGVTTEWIETDWIETPCLCPSSAHEMAARERQAQLTKPPGSLGSLEALAIALAGLQRTEIPRARHTPIILFAGDHGVTAQNISAYPPAVTVEMLKNFARGGAAISVLARELGAPLTVVDAGTLSDEAIPGVIVDKPRAGTRDFAVEAALSPDELNGAFAAGRRQMLAAAHGADLVLFGEMGIGNTTSAAAIAAALLARAPEEIAGAGTGLANAGVLHKARVIEGALRLHNLFGAPPRRVLQAVGGLEIAALTGGIVAAAAAGVPVLVDGFIVSVAALAAVRLNPSCRPWLLFSHRSAEQGHRIVLDALEAKPILDLGLRLGEGSGAATALAVVRLAVALHNGMATFSEAAVSGPQPSCP